MIDDSFPYSPDVTSLQEPGDGRPPSHRKTMGKTSRDRHKTTGSNLTSADRSLRDLEVRDRGYIRP